MTAPQKSHYDAIVIGAGPAGSTAAYELARAGKHVLLLDRANFPRLKVCGCCIAPPGADALHSIGLSHILRDASIIRRATIKVAHSAATVPSPAYRILSRESLDSRLADAARNAGAEVLFSTRARVLPDGSVSIDTGKHPLHARAIIVADGLGGTSLTDHPKFTWKISKQNRMGLGTTLDHAPLSLASDEIVMLCHSTGYLGLVQLPSGRINTAAALDPAAVQSAGGPTALCSKILSSCGIDPQPLQDASWHGTPLLTRARPIIESNNIFILGDAAGYVEPFTGEGMSWAFQSAIELSKVVIATLESRNTAGAWTAAHRALLATHHRRCKLLSQFIRHPLLLQLGIHTINHIPSASSLASRLLSPFAPTQLDEQRQPA